MWLDIFRGKTVLVTGHTGFKGAWLAIWLQHLGATVIGYALEAPTQPSIFESADLNQHLTHIHGDIRATDQLTAVMRQYQPDFVFHLAAQPLVLTSYAIPKETFEINVIGSLSVLDAIRASSHRCSVIMVVTDKCYENREWVYSYREVDPLGGYDPYSASKAAMEIAVASYRQSFGSDNLRIASVRSGNVIGGGDWADNRIVPDIIRSLLNSTTIDVRNPQAVRPWMHVLDPLYGYLCLAAQLHSSDNWQPFASAWNFGPTIGDDQTVQELVETFIRFWGSGSWQSTENSQAPHEARTLRVNIDKAYHELGWLPLWNIETSIQHTVAWYQQHTSADVYDLCIQDIAHYEADLARRRNMKVTA